MGESGARRRSVTEATGLLPHTSVSVVAPSVATAHMLGRRRKDDTAKLSHEP